MEPVGLLHDVGVGIVHGSRRIRHGRNDRSTQRGRDHGQVGTERAVIPHDRLVPAGPDDPQPGVDGDPVDAPTRRVRRGTWAGRRRREAAGREQRFDVIGPHVEVARDDAGDGQPTSVSITAASCSRAPTTAMVEVRARDAESVAPRASTRASDCDSTLRRPRGAAARAFRHSSSSPRAQIALHCEPPTGVRFAIAATCRIANARAIERGLVLELGTDDVPIELLQREDVGVERPARVDQPAVRHETEATRAVPRIACGTRRTTPSGRGLASTLPFRVETGTG